MDKPRYFLHFKGGLYKLLAIGKDSESLKEMVIYQAMYGDKGVWVRPKSMFFERIIQNGTEIQRFKEITEEEMLCLYQEQRENI